MVFQQAAYWSSSNTLILCYLKDVLAAEVSFTSAVLKSSSSGSRSAGAAPRVPVVFFVAFYLSLCLRPLYPFPSCYTSNLKEKGGKALSCLKL